MVHRTVFVSFMVGPGRTPGFMSVHVWFGAQHFLMIVAWWVPRPPLPFIID